MTKEELLNAWDKICYCCTDSAAYPIKELAMIARVLVAYEDKQAISDKTSDKYRWHDLRKDPNDLPKHIDQVIVCVKGSGRNWVDAMFYDHERKLFTIYGRTVYEKSRYIGDNINDVIAWREVDEFEVSK